MTLRNRQSHLALWSLQSLCLCAVNMLDR
uniref:Uncharacterized protein n=1 Tax=Anguilla anguilla TaxID=7936 RepID=A0A0E9QDS4_ANGAN